MLDPSLPEILTGPAAWTGSDMKSRPEEWLVQLSADNIADLEQAARRYLALGRNIATITNKDFPLGPFADHLRRPGNLPDLLRRHFPVRG